MRGRYRSALVVGAVLVLLLPCGAGMSVAGAVRPSSSSSSPAGELRSVPAAPDIGNAPVRGGALTCAGLSSEALSCAHGSPLAGPVSSAASTPPAARDPREPRPRVAGAPGWYNQTGVMSRGSSGEGNRSQYEAAAAYDPNTQQVVVFGGCGASCPSNQTWTWNGNRWTNETPLLVRAPPALYGESMAWDPAYNASILVGGVLKGGSLSNLTWALSSTPAGTYEWLNLTGLVGAYDAGIGTELAALAYDDYFHELILVDGCAVIGCSTVWSSEWVLSNTSWSAVGSGPAGSPANRYLLAPSMAYDRADREMVFFGGWSIGTGTSVNFTYVLPTNGTWTNVTSSSASCSTVCHYPGPRWGASMAWDGQLQKVVLVGGASLSPSTRPNETWLFSADSWSPASLTASLPPASTPVYGAMPTNSSEIAPVLLGGECALFCQNDSWVLEIPPQPQSLRVTPSPADAGMPVSISGSNALGSGSGPTFFEKTSDTSGHVAFGHYSANFSTTFSYSASFVYGPGRSNITVNESDFFGLFGSATYDLTVNARLTSAPVASPSPAELSGGKAKVAFLGGRAGGTAPYSYTWGFGDGSGSSGVNPEHNYTSPGTFTGWLNVTDSAGEYNNSTFLVTVYPELTITASASVTSTEAGSPVGFTGTAGGGSGAYPTEQWQFGQGGPTASGLEATHAFGEAGTYAVYFNLTDSAGYTNSTQLAIVVDPPLAGTSNSNVSTTDAGLAVQFTGTASGGPGTYRAETWQFGEGGPTASGLSTTHAFADAGTYTVFFNITDSLGFVNSTQVMVVVDPVLTGTASASTISPHVGDAVTFTGIALNGTGYDRFRWTFGDGGTASTATAEHTYNSSGTYAVSLTIGDAVGGKVVEHLTITVSAKPTSLLAGLTTGTGLYALTGIVVVIVVVAVVVGTLLVRRRRRSGDQTVPGGLPTAPTGSGKPPPTQQGTPPAAPPGETP